MSVRPAPPIPDSPFDRLLSHPSSQPLVHVNRSQPVGNPWLYSHRQMEKEKLRKRIADGGGGGEGVEKIRRDVEELKRSVALVDSELLERIKAIEGKLAGNGGQSGKSGKKSKASRGRA